MSKASKWIEKKPAPFRVPGLQAFVTYEGNAKAIKGASHAFVFTPDEAKTLATWLLDTFTDESGV